MCPDREIISAFIDGELDPPWNGTVADHIASCDRCREIRERLEKTRRRLQAETPLDWQAPMERVRQAILARVYPVTHREPVWRRHVSVPLPVTVLAAVLLLALGVSLAVALARMNVGYIRVTKAPAGGTEYQFAIPYDKVEALLKSIGGEDANIEAVMTLPKNVKLVPVGEPRMGKAAEFPGIRP